MTKRGLILLAPIVLSLASGCPSPPAENSQGNPLIASRPLMPRDTRAADSENKNYMLVVRLHLACIEVPVGTISDSEELWSYLDEESVRQVRAPAMGFNGLRIGLGRKDTWPDVAGVLKRMTGRRLQESTTMALPGNPVPIVLKRDQPAQTLFTYRADRTLRGVDYPPGDNLLAVACTLNEDDPSKVLITGMPQIRTSRRRPRFINQNGKMMMVARQDVFSLTPLTFQVTVASNDFLVIGPGLESGRPSSVGHAFLVNDRHGVEFETVLVIKPEVFAAPAGRPKPVKLRPTSPKG